MRPISPSLRTDFRSNGEKGFIASATGGKKVSLPDLIVHGGSVRSRTLR
jgi:hypothetical protein